VSTLVLPPTHPAYPTSLAALPLVPRAREGGPPTLHVRGALPLAPGVAIVGTRDASYEALAFTRALATSLVELGVVVWSGGARGIDGAAHEAALAAGGTTVVVLAGGLARPYPREHVPLFERVVAHGGALVARVDDDEPPLPHRFLLRNEVLAALTCATFVIEAGLASGARGTAAAARKLGRLLAAVPHPPWCARGAGNALELELGASALTSLRAAQKLLSGLGVTLTTAPSRERASTARAARPLARELSEAEGAVWKALGNTAIHVEELCEKTGLAFGATTAALLTLTLAAVVVEAPAGFYRRIPRRPSPSGSTRRGRDEGGLF
jgi:DNA processing protein